MVQRPVAVVTRFQRTAAHASYLGVSHRQLLGGIESDSSAMKFGIVSKKPRSIRVRWLPKTKMRYGRPNFARTAASKAWERKRWSVKLARVCLLRKWCGACG